MNNIKAFIPFLFIATGAFLLTPAFAEDVIDIGAINRDNAEQILPIEIQSNDAQLDSLLRMAFSTHGGYALVASGKSAFTFIFERIGQDAVKVTVESGNPKQTLYSQEFNAKNWRQAALAAADNVVEKTLGIPGYFSGKIAFVGERNGVTEIYTGDLFFQNIKQLTKDRAEVSFPRFSPNGRQLIFTSYYKSGFPDIFLVDLVTGERKPFATYEGTNTGAAFSPDGKSVAMILSSSGNPEL